MSTPAPEPAETRRSPLWRILKWTGISLGTLIALLIIAIVVIPHFVNTGPIKHEIERIASRSTGRDVTISGPLSLSLFPWAGFDAKDITMANKAGFGKGAFLTARELDIHVKLIPLIFHRVEVSGLTLDRLSVNLVRKADGTSNWQGLARAGGKPSSGQASGSGLAALSVASIAVRDSTLTYDDEAAHKRYALSAFGLKAGGIRPGQSFPLAVQFKLASQQPHFVSSIKLDTRAEFNAAMDAVRLDNGSLSADISNAGLGANPLAVTTSWQAIAVDRRAETARLSGLTLKVAGLSARLDADASRLATSPVVTGHLEVAPFAPRKLFTALGNPIPTTLRGFNSASLKTDLRADAKSAGLSNLTLKIDDTTLTGSAAVAMPKMNGLHFDLAADRLDLDHFLPPGSGPAAHAATPHGPSFLETRLPGRLLNKLDISGRLKVAQLTGFGLSAQDAAITVKAAQGTATLYPISVRLYGGRFTGKLALAAAGAGVRLNTDDKLAGVDAGKLVTALYGTQRLTGTADAAVTLAGQGNSVAELIDTLKGKAAFSLSKGSVEGFNLWQSLERAYALVKEHKVVSASGPNRTEFADIRGTATIANNVLTNDSLTADLPFLSLTGHGTVNLRSSYVNYDLLGKVVKAPKTAGMNLSQLQGLTVPVHISGYAKSLTSVPDMKQALAETARRALQKKLDAEKKAAESKLKRQLQNLLNTGGGGGGG